MDELEIMHKHRSVFNGTLFMIKEKKYPPWEPSGNKGRYSGCGTPAYYLGDTLETCWREIQSHNPNANSEDYRFWAVPLKGTFIDVGAVEGTRYLEHKKAGGYTPTLALSERLTDQNIFGFRYASQPAFSQGTCGTCFCVYQSILNLGSAHFYEIPWKPQ